MSPRRTFRFRFSYFKPSGKWYDDVEVSWEANNCGLPWQSVAYIHDAVAKVRGLRDAGGPGAMPGLAGEGWDGPILVRSIGYFATAEEATRLGVPEGDFVADDGVPHLLLPASR